MRSGRECTTALSTFESLDGIELSYKSKKLRPSWLDRAKIRVKSMLGMHTLLCDSCKWDWRSACHNPERPNAVWCPDYEKRGT